MAVVKLGHCESQYASTFNTTIDILEKWHLEHLLKIYSGISHFSFLDHYIFEICCWDLDNVSSFMAKFDHG